MDLKEQIRAYLTGAGSLAERVERVNELRSVIAELSPFADEPVTASRVGFTVNAFRSGEITGARFFTGSSSKLMRGGRSGAITTECLTKPARTKIRRAIQCASDTFRCFMTVTFSPDHLKPWHVDDQGVVLQEYAKYKFKKFLHSIKVARDRRSVASGRESDRIAYVWVAELQENGNVHYHVLLNHRLPIVWLTGLWGQAKNSIDVRSINNINHASCYLRKYMAKERSRIDGNRYGITQNLRETMRPEKTTVYSRELNRHITEVVHDMRQQIIRNGGHVTDYGFYLPTPRRPAVYRDHDGNKQTSPGISRYVGTMLLQQVGYLIATMPF